GVILTEVITDDVLLKAVRRSGVVIEQVPGTVVFGAVVVLHHRFADPAVEIEAAAIQALAGAVAVGAAKLDRHLTGGMGPDADRPALARMAQEAVVGRGTILNPAGVGIFQQDAVAAVLFQVIRIAGIIASHTVGNVDIPVDVGCRRGVVIAGYA